MVLILLVYMFFHVVTSKLYNPISPIRSTTRSSCILSLLRFRCGISNYRPPVCFLPSVSPRYSEQQSGSIIPRVRRKASSSPRFLSSSPMPNPHIEEVPRTTGCDPSTVEIDDSIGRKLVVECLEQKPGWKLDSLPDAADLLVVGAEGLSKQEMEKITEAKIQQLENSQTGSPQLIHDGDPIEQSIQLTDQMADFDNTTTGDHVFKHIINRDEFKAKIGSSCCGRVGVSTSPVIRHVCVLGFGGATEFTAAGAAKAGEELANVVKKLKAVKVDVLVPEFVLHRQIQALVESFLLYLTPDNRFKSQLSTWTKPAVVQSIRFLVRGENAFHKAGRAVNTAKIVARGVNFAQQLVAAPANFVNTVTLAQQAAKLAKEYNMEIQILDKSDVEKLNMGAYLAVAKGSMYPPKFIHITYKPNGTPRKRFAFIGKGICFDAGGYNMKNAACQIELMKFDMGGAAAVLGTALVIGALRPAGIEVHFLVAAAENMVSDKAYRPGDVITASNGKTIEVGNTDAEGRLTMADALVFADKMRLNGIVDIATLTGACVVALGPKYAGVFSPNDEFVDEVMKSGSTSGELLWHMPIVSQYREMLDSNIADMNNVGGGGKGGAITAAVFLKEFVQKTPWVHIDIAGPAWDLKESRATGFGVRTLAQLVINQADDVQDYC